MYIPLEQIHSALKIRTRIFFMVIRNDIALASLKFILDITLESLTFQLVGVYIPLELRY